MDPETMALLNYFLASQTSLDPTMQMMLGGLISPNVNKYGELDQFGVDLEKTNLNQYQDITGTFANPMNTLMAGLGAVGPAPLGGGVVGGGGLDPITTETILETPATLRFRQLAERARQGGQVTPETYIAQMLVGDPERGVLPVDPSVIVADLQAKMADPTLDATTKNLFNSWLPRIEKKDMQGNPSGEFVTDWNAAASKIEKAAEPYLMEQTTIDGPNIGTNNYGQYVQYSEQPSEMMQYLQKLGLPDPRAQYGVEFSVQNDPALQELMVSMGTKGQAFEEAQKAYKSYLKNKPLAQGMARQAERLGAQREDRFKNDLIAYNRSMADWARGLEAPKAPPITERTESYEAGPPGWLGKVGGAIGGAVSSVPGHINEMLTAAHPKPITPNPMGFEGIELLPEVQRPTPPTMPTMPGPGMMEQMLGRIGPGPVGRSGTLFNEMNRQRKVAGEDVLAMVRAIAPGYGAMKAGRTPLKDALMQRLQPILAAGGARR